MDSTSRRGGAPRGLYVRSDRLSRVGGSWRVVTREGIEVGPFTHRPDAEAAAARIATLLDGIDDPVIAAAFIREEFNLLRGP
jgi:hypothetical protein